MIMGEDRNQEDLKLLTAEFGPEVTDLVIAKKREAERYCPSGGKGKGCAQIRPKGVHYMQLSVHFDFYALLLLLRLPQPTPHRRCGRKVAI